MAPPLQPPPAPHRDRQVSTHHQVDQPARSVQLEDADLATVAADTDAVISEAQAALTDLDRATQIEVVPFTGTVSDRFAELAASLANEDAPVALRQALLRDFGVMRIYVDNPGIRVELL